MPLKKVFLEAAWGKAAPLLLTAALLGGCASAPRLQAEETLQDDCTVLRELKAEREGTISEHYRQIVDVPARCKNYQLLAVIAAQEVKNRTHYPLATNAALILLAEMEDDIKAAFVRTLARAGVTIPDLEAAKEAAVPECRRIDSGGLESGTSGRKTINFLCQ